MKTIGFIGTGNMGSALARSAALSKLDKKILLSNRTRAKAEALATEIKAEVSDNKTIAQEADIIFLGVKPQFLNDVYEEIAPILKQRPEKPLYISMMAGNSLAKLSALFDESPIIRVMPNMPAMIGEGLSFYALNDKATAEDKECFLDLLKASGKLEELDEKMIEAANGISGCGPAFTAMFIEALADGAVACGLPRRQAILYAAEMIKGTAEMLIQSGKHPAQLKDSVCSPGGQTIQGVRRLEEGAFRAAVMNAVIATFEKKF